jgi:hypothetical protein
MNGGGGGGEEEKIATFGYGQAINDYLATTSRKRPYFLNLIT